MSLLIAVLPLAVWAFHLILIRPIEYMFAILAAQYTRGNSWRPGSDLLRVSKYAHCSIHFQ